MWNLLTSEIKYNMLHFIGILIFVPIIYFAGLSDPDSDMDMLVILIGFIFAMTIYTVSAKEKRIRFFMRFPVPVWQIGLVRVIILILPFIFSVSILYIVYFVYGNLQDFRQVFILAFIFLYITGFCLTMVIRDTLLNFPRLVEFLNKLKFGIIFGISFLVFGLFVFTLASRDGGEPPYFFKYIDMFFDLVISETGVLVFSITSVLFLILSVITFKHRPTYIEHDCS